MIRSARFFVQFRRIAKTTGARDDSVRRGFVGVGRGLPQALPAGFAVKREFGTGVRGARRFSRTQNRRRPVCHGYSGSAVLRRARLKPGRWRAIGRSAVLSVMALALDYSLNFLVKSQTTGARDDSVRRGFMSPGVIFRKSSGGLRREKRVWHGRSGSAALFGGLRIDDGRFVTGIPGAPSCAGHA